MSEIFASVGSIVTCHDRHSVVLPSENPDIVRLRPLSGSEELIWGIYQQLELEAIAPAQFPQPEAIQDHTAIQLLMDAARLSLRSGAGPYQPQSKVLPQMLAIAPLPLLPHLTQR